MDNVNAQESRNRGTQRIKLCSINICGMSDRSRTLLDKYSDKEELDLLFVQETGSSCKNKLNLTNMNIVTDQNNAKNRGAALYARGNVSLTNLSNLALI
jgi:predicted outer membrane repeat protein